MFPMCKRPQSKVAENKSEMVREIPLACADEDAAIAWYVNTLADEWERETGGLSFMADRVTHRAYKTLLSMRMHAVPHLLVRMRQRGGLWFWLLSNVTGVRLQPIGDGGNVAAMTRAWLKWGVERGLIREERPNPVVPKALQAHSRYNRNKRAD